MNLIKFSVENHHFTIIIVALLVIFGLNTANNMPKTENPEIQPPGGSIIVIYPGATPSDMEELVTFKIEKEINGINEISEIQSTSGNSFSNIVVDFDFGVDMDEKFSVLTEKVNGIKDELPDEITSIDIIKHEISNVFVLELALVSETAPYKDMERELEKLQDEIEKIDGIRQVVLDAYPDEEVRVSIDLEKMARLNIPLNRVIGLIQSTNTNIPGGSMNLGGKNLNINTSGAYKTLDEIRDTIIPVGSGSIVYLKDIARVEYDYQDLKYSARFNGKRAILLLASQKEGTNIFQIIGSVKSKIAEFNKTLPQDMEIHYVYDQSEGVSNFVSAFILNLLEGIILVGFVVWLGIGNRPAIIVMLTIPASICIAIGVVGLSGYGVQQMTIAGLVIALGLLVDNAIVVTENVDRFILEGHDLKSAAIKGTTQIAASIASGTITTCIAFIPILLMSDVAGEYVRSMPLTVIYTLLASLLLALTFAPYLSSVFLTKKSALHISVFQKGVKKFIEKYYRKTLKKSLSKPKTIIWTSVIVFTLSMGLVPLVGVSMFPKSDKALFFINITTPEGTSLQQTDETIQYIEKDLLQKPYVKHILANIGGDNPRIYYNLIPQQNKTNIGQIYVELEKKYAMQIPDIMSELLSQYAVLPGVKIEMKQLEQGYPNDAPIAMKIIGTDIEKLKNISADVERMFYNTEGLINIVNPLDNQKVDLQININREKTAMLGIPLTDVDKTIRICLSGLDVATFRNENSDEFDIVVRMPVNESPVLADFDKIFITAANGAQIPLKQLADINFTSGPLNFYHYQLERNNTIMADVQSGYSINEKSVEIINKLENYDWPEGYYFKVSGEKESQGKAFGGLGTSFIIAMIGILAVLVFQFKSFTQPLIIFSSIPLAIIGSIIALFLTGNSLSFTAMIGLTSLAGIVINNAIILVDYANELRRDGKDVLTAIMISGETRFVPIILTVATTVGGLLPLTLFGGSMWGPMGWAIIGGLLTSTVLTLFVVPVLYKVFTRDII